MVRITDFAGNDFRPLPFGLFYGLGQHTSYRRREIINEAIRNLADDGSWSNPCVPKYFVGIGVPYAPDHHLLHKKGLARTVGLSAIFLRRYVRLLQGHRERGS